MSTEQSKSALQVETQAAPAVDITQQATTPTPTTQRERNLSVWLLEKRHLKERGRHGNNRRKMPRLIGLAGKIR